MIDRWLESDQLWTLQAYYKRANEKLWEISEALCHIMNDKLAFIFSATMPVG